MRIGIDARLYGITGIGRYVKNLIKELEKQDSENKYVIFLQKKNFKDYQPHNPHFSKIEVNAPYYSFAEQIIFLFKIMTARVNLVHFVNYNVPLLYFGARIITIHDLVGKEFSTFGMTTRNIYYYRIKRFISDLVLRWSVSLAKKVIVPSYATKNDLVKSLRLDSSKAAVIYEGLDEVFRLPATGNQQSESSILLKYGIRKPYLLYVSTMYPYKNHQTLIEAFELLIKEPQFQNLQLVLVGKEDFFSRKIREFVVKKNLADRVIMPLESADQGYLSDEKLVEIFRNADLYVFPSLKEGFGLTILEAWAKDVPVVASMIPVICEIGQEGVFYFDHKNKASIKEAIQTVLNDQPLRETLIQAGHRRLNDFSWQKMAVEIKKIYDEFTPVI